VAGALIAVPLAAAVNAVVLHLADETAPPPPTGDDDMGEELGEDPGTVGDFDVVGGRPE
jgi:hypothetical protein